MPDTTDGELPVELQLFTDFLEEHSSGRAVATITADLQEVVQRCREVGKEGSLTITVKVTPLGQQQTGRQVSTTIGTTKKLPTWDPEVAIHYVGEGGTLHDEDPYANKLSLARAPEPDDEPLVAVDGPTVPDLAPNPTTRHIP